MEERSSDSITSFNYHYYPQQQQQQRQEEITTQYNNYYNPFFDFSNHNQISPPPLMINTQQQQQESFLYQNPNLNLNLPPTPTPHEQMTTLPFIIPQNHLRLPPLHSLEYPPAATSSSHHHHHKRSRTDHQPQNNNNNQSASSARDYRKKLGEKIRCLQKLMPWDKKMDTATSLHEAYKYLNFLKAQLTVLQSMPPSFNINNNNFADVEWAHGGGDQNGCCRFGGGLWRLNRQQVLEVLINSPAAQTWLSSRGFCVFSFEELLLLKQKAATRIT
ncbi:hypothetical protein ACFE04_018915 [Oxalis oulophora]